MKNISARITRTALTAVFALSALAACGGDDDTLVVGNGDLLLSGTITREETAGSDNDPFVPVVGAHLVLSLRRTNTTDSTLPSIESDTAYRGLPLSFELHGIIADVFPDKSALDLTATFYNHAGTIPAVGDLMTEAQYVVTGAGQHFDLLVSGLESCSSGDTIGSCVAVDSPE